MPWTQKGNMSPELTRAVSSLQRIALDDSIAGEPHARAARIADHGRRAEWPWRATSMRITSYTHDFRELARSDDLQRWWTDYKIVLRAGRLLRNPRLRRLGM